MTSPRPFIALLLAVSAHPLVGCVADLGPCDELEARRLVFTNDLEGAPAYAGQAMVITSCGNGGFCHADVAPAQRFGVPAGLSFDLRVATAGHDLERLRRAHGNVVDLAGRMYDAVVDDRMPPGGRSEDVRALAREYRGLPPLESPEGRAILRNWLACGAPVVERVSDDRPDGVAPIGAVVAAAPGTTFGCGGTGQRCGDHCASIHDDAARCGDCGTPCSVGGTCVDAACSACAPGLTLCGGTCVDTVADREHCGACDAPCAEGEVCAGSVCIAADCGGGTAECAGACVDVATSPFHCGACDSPCRPGESCVDGACDCGDTTADPFDCGACGNVCPPGAACIDSACVCEEPFTECGGACVRIDSDEAHCGACDAPCSGTDRCVDGACAPCGTGISFAGDVLGILDGACVGSLCHGGAEPAGGLALDVSRAYEALVNVPSRCEPAHLLVDPFDPEQSHLMDKLTGEDHCSHSRMPLGAAPLSSDDVDVFRSWICGGSPRN
jgi:hypothetical protein